MRAWLAALATALTIIAPADLRAQAVPPPPAPAIAAAVGEYGTGDNLLTVYEQGGQLYLNGRGLQASALWQISPGRYTGAVGEVAFAPDAVILSGERLPRRDVGAETVAEIQAGVKADPARVRAAALAATPPAEPPARRASDLVSLTSLDPTIRLDIRYASTNNFMGFPLYERSGAWLQRPAAEALARAAKTLKAQGYGLLIHDGYRPWFVTRMFWDATPAYAHVFVADPAKGSRHNRGCAVDLTLYDLKTGEPVEMTGRYDEMSRRSYADYVGGTSRQRWTRDLLRKAMEAEGFSVFPEEWWHFDYKDWRDYPIGTETFSQLVAAGR
ncbi:M15 family metallopeptidase [Phenylobacterium aquaticum]|uniref:M15 family metallopeptidase n=1 Tax=Phenylobacterium aquaticum TaxID=1763816 RepID=UPI001F5CE642|nr:M15 family metallopeptidase [Phenylobacterium aquaticum]MCI3135501.1 M15 family metallopeptidase [Phenylobacterium aquaticum]